MNTMNVNGQNGVATSALKNAVVKAVKKIDKAENAIGSYVKINDGIRLYYHGQRFIKGTKDNFIFNAKIERRDVDDRYNNYAVVFKYENLDNEEGLYLDSMVNGIIDAILNATDETIVKKIDAAENGDDWSKQFADNLQNFRNDYFGSRLAVDNADDLDSPDALDIDEDYNLEFLRNRMPVIPIDLIKQGVDEYLDDEYEYRRYCGTGRFECDFEEFADKVWENVWALVLDNDLSDEFIENDTRNYMEFNDRLYYMIDSENINGLFLHNDNVCQNFDDDDDENDEPDALIGFENASEECDGNMMACVDKYDQEFIDEVIKKYSDVVYNAVSEYDLDDTIKYCVRGALDYMEYDPEKKILVGCSDVPDLGNWDDEEEFCNYFEDAYGFDWDSCQEFYQTYCNDIWHFADEYDDRMEDALRDFEKESVFDKMPYEIIYDDEYLKVYIDMDDFVAYIKKNMVFNADKAQLYKYNDMGIILYNMLDSDNVDVDKHFKDLNYSWLFCRDLENMLPMVTDVKLYDDDGLYLWYDDITIRNFFEKHKIDDGWGTYVTADPINNYVDEFLSPDAVKTFFNLVEKDEDWSFYIDEDADGDLYVSGNEGIYKNYFDDYVPMIQVYSYLIDKMNEEIIKTETEIENEIEGAEK